MRLSKNKSLFLLHFIIIIWGFTGILGKIINLTSEVIVWNRMIIAYFALLLINQFTYRKIKINPKDFLKYIFIGGVTAIHWICFFESIKISTVSLALICLSSISLFTAILEPLIQKRKILFYEIILSLLIIIGIIIIFNYEKGYEKAVFLAIISAFCGALFTVLNHKLIQTGHKALIITCWEMFGGVVMVSLYLLITNQINSNMIAQKDDIIYILILGLICTAFAFSISIEIMKKLSPFTVNISVNLEPIYAIILALIIFGEEEKMSREFYVGSLIILISIGLNTILKQKKINN